MTSEFLLKPVPHEEAMKFIAGKPVLSREVFDKLIPDVRARAFTITGIESMNTLQRVRDQIAKLPAGADWDVVKESIVQEVSPWLVTSSDPEERDKEIAGANRRAELLLRTHGFQAYQSAQYEAMERQKEVLPFWQYMTMEDEAVRPEHEALDGLVLPADSPFWADHFPPWDWGCRCQVVPLLEEDAAAIEAGDQDGFIPGPEATKKLEEQGILDTGDGHPINVSSPRNSGKDNPFYWHPGDLRIPREGLEKRYDAETWKDFSAWAKKAGLDDAGTSVWDWLGGAPVDQGRPAPIAPPAPAPIQVAKPVTPKAPKAIQHELKLPPEILGKPAVSSGAKGAPVSAGLDVKISDKLSAQRVQHAISVIDRVHGDGNLPKIPIVGLRGRNLGEYSFSGIDGRPFEIRIRKDGPWSALTSCHEIGHFLDHHAVGQGGVFASQKSPELDAWRKAVSHSSAVKALEFAPLSKKERDYFLSSEEIWARAYAQYIAEKSMDPTLMNDLRKISESPLPARQWTPEDFAPIKEAMDKLFKKKGWI